VQVIEVHPARVDDATSTTTSNLLVVIVSFFVYNVIPWLIADVERTISNRNYKESMIIAVEWLLVEKRRRGKFERFYQLVKSFGISSRRSHARKTLFVLLAT